MADTLDRRYTEEERLGVKVVDNLPLLDHVSLEHF